MQAKERKKTGAAWTGQLDAPIATFAAAAIALHLILRFAGHVHRTSTLLPLWAALLLGGAPLVLRLARKMLRGEFSSDLLAGIAIVASVLLGEYLVGSIVVLMLSGGTTLEQFATRRASSVLNALAKRMPQTAHRNRHGSVTDVGLEEIAVGDVLVVYPHEICPVDGVVIEGHGVMDESYLTGEPFEMSKAPGSPVLSGAINQASALTIVAEKPPSDSRYARIMRVMEESEQKRPRLRRLGDVLGAWYTPAAVSLAAVGWAVSSDPRRFLAVIVIATPCPLLIAIPVAIVGAISLSARRSILIKNPAVLEQVATCRTLIFDKTGTLTRGKPVLTDISPAPGFSANELLLLAASLEKYSKHPLAGAVLKAARAAKLTPQEASSISEKPGEGLWGKVRGQQVHLTGRNKVQDLGLSLPEARSGLECLLFIDGRYAGLFRFHDAPRQESKSFLAHLAPRHGVTKILLVSGDRESEVRYLAEQVGIADLHFSASPEEKLAIVQKDVALGKTLFVGDGINDAPALQAATVGVAFGPNSDITSEAAGAVILAASLDKVDELIHIGRRFRAIALQSAVGGMALSAVGMALAALGYLPPLAGAVAQEIIDLLAVLNSLRMALPFDALTDYGEMGDPSPDKSPFRTDGKHRHPQTDNV
jgi:heavy metal translocating P-type ATPase